MALEAPAAQEQPALGDPAPTDATACQTVPDSTPSPTPILNLANNITVRPFLLTDAPSFAHNANSRLVSQHMSNRFPFPFTVSDAETFIAGRLDPAGWPPLSIPGVPASATDIGKETLARTPIPSAYVITGPSDPSNSSSRIEAIGSIGLNISSNPTDMFIRTASIGYWLTPSHWGRGLATTLVTAFVQWVWTESPWTYLARIEAGVFAGNEASERVLEKCGFVREGERRAAVWKEGKLRDDVLFGFVRPGLVADVRGRGKGVGV